MRKFWGVVSIIIFMSICFLQAAYEIGDTGPGGGIVFFVDTDNTYSGFDYLEAAPEASEFAAPWGVYAQSVTGADDTAIGSGYQNTNDLLLQYPGSNYAANQCNELTTGGKNDWFLPSKDELNLMYENLYNQATPLGGFSGGYWSSSEANSTSGWLQDFYDGAQKIGMGKGNEFNVRAIRSFSDAVVPGYSSDYDKTGDIATYTANKNSNSFASLVIDDNAVGIVVSENAFNDISMGLNPQGSPYISMPAETNPIAQAINADATGALFVTASFQNVDRPIIMLNGIQITDMNGNPFPGYEGYIRNVSYDGSTLTFEITHFSEYGVPVVVADDTFVTAGTAPGAIAASATDLLITLPNSDTVTADGVLDESTTVLDIHGLAYETILTDVPQTLNNLYKPLIPGTTYNISFEYINRGNVAESVTLARTIERTNTEHYTISDNDYKADIEPWQIVSFNFEVNASDAYAYERATVNTTISIDGSAVSYSAFADAYIGGTYGDSGQYGGLDLFNSTFVLEAAGVELNIVNRLVEVFAPIGYDGDPVDIDNVVPGSKIKYSIVIQNNNAATVPSIDLKDVVPQNCHLFYDDTPLVEGISSSNYNWKGATNNMATSASENAVWFEITIPGNTTVTASYTVTLD